VRPALHVVGVRPEAAGEWLVLGELNACVGHAGRP
jgi:hypothetical protein